MMTLEPRETVLPLRKNPVFLMDASVFEEPQQPHPGLLQQLHSDFFSASCSCFSSLFFFVAVAAPFFASFLVALPLPAAALLVAFFCAKGARCDGGASGM